MKHNHARSVFLVLAAAVTASACGGCASAPYYGERVVFVPVPVPCPPPHRPPHPAYYPETPIAEDPPSDVRHTPIDRRQAAPAVPATATKINERPPTESRTADRDAGPRVPAGRSRR